MPTLSRRHLVTTAAALPALAVPAFASIISDPRTLTAAEVGDLYASLDDSDKREISASIRAQRAEAELLRLGVELEAVIVEWHAQRAIDRTRSVAMEAASDAAGFPDIPYGSLPDDEWRAYQDKRCAAWHTVTGATDDDNDPWNNIHGRMWPLIDDIMGHKPRTLAGLAVVARAFTLHHAEQFEADADEGLHHRAFMEAVCGFAGVMPVPCDGAPVVAVARQPDPIFALIDKARAATEAHGRSCQGEPVLAEGGLALGTPEYAAWDEANEAACHASWKALRELLATQPTTRAGMGAQVRYVTGIHPAEIGEPEYRALFDRLNAHFVA